MSSTSASIPASVPASTSRCGCCAADPVSLKRRRIIAIAVAGLAAPLAPAFAAGVDRIEAGDRLADEDGEGAPVALTPADIPAGKTLLAFPFDPASGQRRDGTRLNKVLLMRLPEGELDADTRGRSAGGVVAYSAICTHQGCDLKTWSAKEQLVVCFCHSSKFDIKDSGAVAGGPAPRSLPNLPLRLEGGQLVVAGPFSATPGGMVS
ncbi:MAG: Rieske (2Fe-2S) protein [Burkholderiales bacterium]|nr:Rieske (2Fe-2S) protein [Burkholderiales bacterium]